MTLAFDTSILIEIERENKYILEKLRELKQLHRLPSHLPFISYYEFIKGLKTGKPKNYNDLLHFVKSFHVLQTTTVTADILSDLKIKYDKKGIAISLADMLIASQIIEHNLILVTCDKDFEKIEELKKIIL